MPIPSPDGVALAIHARAGKEQAVLRSVRIETGVKGLPIGSWSGICLRHALRRGLLAARNRAGGRRGREAEGGGLLNRYRVVKPYRGFESLRLRHGPDPDVNATL